MKSRTVLSILGLILFAVAPSYSQGFGGQKPCHFRAISWNVPITDLFLAQTPPPLPDPANPAKSLPLNDYKEIGLAIQPTGRSGFYPYQKQKPLFFVRHDGQLYKTVATLDLSNAPDLSLLFFIPGKTKDSYTIKVIPDDSQNFPGGAFRFINMGTIPVIVVLCGESTSVAPNEIKTISPNSRVPNRADMVLLRSSDKQEQYSNVWVVTKQVRYLMFIVNDTTTPGRVDCLRLVDPVASATDPNPTPTPE